MINFLIILVIVALAAWLGNVLMQLEAIVSHSRSRVRGARDTIGKLESTLKRLHREEENLGKEIADLNNDIVAARRKQSEVQHKLTEAQGRRRPRLLILSDRRNASDKEWIVTVANTQIGEVDASHPLAAEWARGREYLVWAETDRDAGERAMRRFSARPGYSIKSVAAAKEDIFPNVSAAAAARAT